MFDDAVASCHRRARWALPALVAVEAEVRDLSCGLVIEVQNIHVL